MKKTLSALSLALAASAGLSLSAGTARAAEPDLSKLPAPSTKTGLTYDKDIRPLFEASCFRCHGPRQAKGELRLDSLQAVLRGGENGPVVSPGKSKESSLVVAVAQLDPDTVMPPKRGGRGGPGGRGGFGPGMFLAPAMVSQGDKNADKKLTKDEFTALAETWFDKMDADKSGKVTRDQFVQGLNTVLPPPQRPGAGGPPGQGGQGGRPGGTGGPGGGQGQGRDGGQGGQGGQGGPRGEAARGPGGGGQGGPGGAGGPGGPSGRGGFGGPGGGGFGPARFVGPALFAATDSDKDGSLTRAEFKDSFAKWFDQWDTSKSGSLTEEQIRNGLNAVLPQPDFGGPGGPGGREGRDGPGGQGREREGRDSRGGPGGPGGSNQPGGAGPNRPDGVGGPGGAGGPGGQGGPNGSRDSGRPGGPGGPGGQGGQESKPLTAEQVGLIRAWIDQGAK